MHTNPTGPTVVERELELRLVLSPESGIPVPARLGYHTDDPYAVHITFHIDSGHPVHWTFARDLLVEGVFRPSGLERTLRAVPPGTEGAQLGIDDGLAELLAR